jgi:GNAT superfamily N-acetyltransferase
MFLRCTPQTVYRRFHGQLKAIPASYLRAALAGAASHLGLVAVAGDGSVAGGSVAAGSGSAISSPADDSPAAGDSMAWDGAVPQDRSVAWDGSRVVALASCSLADTGDAVELGVLVEDAWQGHGLGRELLRRLIAYADCLGVPEVHAQVLVEQDWLIGWLRTYGECSSVFRPGIREVRVRRHPTDAAPSPSLSPSAAPALPPSPGTAPSPPLSPDAPGLPGPGLRGRNGR